jgi:diguanylate cyclase (GGDEF)-like protein
LLLIDDSEDVQRLIRHRMGIEGLEVICADNGFDGLQCAINDPPAIILLDLDMPVMDGFEVLRALKDNAGTSQIPVILLSGSDDSEDKVLAFDLGAVDYICKPFETTELRARVRSAMRIAELMHMLAQRAQVDGLTGLWNRAYFNDRLVAEIGACDRSDAPLSLVMCDIDHFKALNDHHGHPAGDEALRGFGRLLVDTLRKEDIACRYGGEEFALLLRMAPASKAKVVIERLREALADIVWPRHPERRVTASFGIVDNHIVASTKPELWVEMADRALYRAKSEGRNRVVVAGAQDAPSLAKAG